jgi:endonuclease/exonuclease/phosphatase family metal-dependent hydrolase
MPPIICGDFNAEPTSDEIRFLTANAVIEGRSTYFQDAWALMGGGRGVTWDPANEFNAESNEPPQRIDYVSTAHRLRLCRRGVPASSRCRPSDERVAGIP